MELSASLCRHYKWLPRYQVVGDRWYYFRASYRHLLAHHPISEGL